VTNEMRPSQRLVVGPGGTGRTHLLRSWADEFEADGGVPFDFNSTFHMHMFGSSVDPATAGQPGGASVGGGAWVVWDRVDGFQGLVSEITLDGILPEKLCVRVGMFPDHTLESLDSGNCIPIVNNS
jgi:hypothetical protein